MNVVSLKPSTVITAIFVIAGYVLYHWLFSLNGLPVSVTTPIIGVHPWFNSLWVSPVLDFDQTIILYLSFITGYLILPTNQRMLARLGEFIVLMALAALDIHLVAMVCGGHLTAAFCGKWRKKGHIVETSAFILTALLLPSAGLPLFLTHSILQIRRQHIFSSMPYIVYIGLAYFASYQIMFPFYPQSPNARLGDFGFYDESGITRPIYGFDPDIVTLNDKLIAKWNQMLGLFAFVSWVLAPNKLKTIIPLGFIIFCCFAPEFINPVTGLGVLLPMGLMIPITVILVFMWWSYLPRSRYHGLLFMFSVFVCVWSAGQLSAIDRHPSVRYSPSAQVLDGIDYAAKERVKPTHEIAAFRLRAFYFHESLSYLSDDNPTTRWSTQWRQQGGEWIQLIFDEPLTNGLLVLDPGIFHSDFPRGLRVEINHGENFAVISDWLGVINYAEWRYDDKVSELPYFGSQQKLVIDLAVLFPEVKVDELKLTQINTSLVNDWSIAEVKVYGTPFMCELWGCRRQRIGDES